MKKTNRILQTLFAVSIAISLILVIIFECDIVAPGFYATYGTEEFAVATTMELITICSIPVLLRTFKFNFVRRKVNATPERSMHNWSLLRMIILCVLMVINTFLYYVFMNVAFGYMAIIIFLCIFLIFPTENRYKKEMEGCKK